MIDWNNKKGFTQHHFLASSPRKKHILNNGAGFTIVEMLVYVGILSLITVILVTTIIQFSDVFGRARFDRKVALTAQSAMERIIRELRLSEHASLSAPGASSITLTTFQDFSNTDTSASKTILLAGSQILLDSVSLTPSDVTVTNLEFHAIDGEGSFTGSEMVRVTMTLEAGQGSYQITRTYESGALLRESY